MIWFYDAVKQLKRTFYSVASSAFWSRYAPTATHDLAITWVSLNKYVFGILFSNTFMRPNTLPNINNVFYLKFELFFLIYGTYWLVIILLSGASSRLSWLDVEYLLQAKVVQVRSLNQTKTFWPNICHLLLYQFAPLFGLLNLCS